MENDTTTTNEGNNNNNNNNDNNELTVKETFLNAAKSGNIEYMIELIKREGLSIASSKADNDDNNTALHIASQYGHIHIVKYLIQERYIDVNILNNLKMHAFHMASRYGHINLVKYFIHERKVDVMVQAYMGVNAFHFACSSGHMDIVKYLVHITSKRIVNTTTFNGWNALHWACCDKHIDIVKFLIDECRIDTSKQCIRGDTALHVAIQTGDMELVKYFIEEKKFDITMTSPKCIVNINQRDDTGCTALHVAMYTGQVDIAKYFIRVHNANIDNSLHVACQYRHFKMVKYLITECCTKSDIDKQDYDGYTALLHAIERDCLDIADYLINQGRADITLATNAGKNVFYFASKSAYHCTDFVVMLLAGLQRQPYRRGCKRKM